MKKLLLLALLAVMMVGCNNEKEIPNKSKKMDEVYHAYTCEIDSCEYIAHGHGLVHKGNCRFCAERRKKELEELIKEIGGEK